MIWSSKRGGPKAGVSPQSEEIWADFHEAFLLDPSISVSLAEYFKGSYLLGPVCLLVESDAQAEHWCDLPLESRYFAGSLKVSAFLLPGFDFSGCRLALQLFVSGGLGCVQEILIQWVPFGCSDALVLRDQFDPASGGLSLQYLQMLWLTSCLEYLNLQPSPDLCLQPYQNRPTTAMPGPPGPLAHLS